MASKRLRDQTICAVRNLVGAGIGSYPTERFHQFSANHMVADNPWHPPRQPLFSFWMLITRQIEVFSRRP
jgi:hypothetical protein